MPETAGLIDQPQSAGTRDFCGEPTTLLLLSHPCPAGRDGSRKRAVPDDPLVCGSVEAL